MAKSGDGAPRNFLARILDTPQLARVVPHLQPALLHRVIQRVGLEDSGELIELATPQQLRGVLDLDLWRSPQPGFDEDFDADRFGLWLEVLAETGAEIAAEKLAQMDVDLLIAGLSQYVLVFDPASVSPHVTTDGEDVAVGRLAEHQLTAQIGGYTIVPRRTDAWDAIVELLVALDRSHGQRFHHVMRGCRAQSDAGREIDGLDDLLEHADQAMFELVVDRERRREQQGYATPAEARAFLRMARQLPLGDGSAPPRNPLAAAYFRGLEEVQAEAIVASAGLPPGDVEAEREERTADLAMVVEMLVDEGLLPERPRGLLESPRPEASPLSRLRIGMQWLAEHDQTAFLQRNEELAYLANVFLAGCSIQSRPFTPQEAADAAAAVCNLGLENWPPHWRLNGGRAGDGPDETISSERFLVDRDLVALFQVGWAVLHRDVCLFVAERLIAVLGKLHCRDRDIQSGLNALRREMSKQWRAGVPWQANDALDVITSLDMTAWAALVGLTGECPVIHAGMDAARRVGMLRVDPNQFEFISENRQIKAVRDFMESLPATLAG